MQQFLKFYYLIFMYSSTCFGRPPAHHQELNCSSSLWFYRWSAVVAVLLVMVGPAGPTATNSNAVRSTYNCNYSIWQWSNCLCYLPLWWRSWNFQLLPSAMVERLELPTATFHYGGEIGTSNCCLPLWWRSWNFQLLPSVMVEKLELPTATFCYGGEVGTSNCYLPLWWRSWNSELLSSAMVEKLELPTATFC